MITQEIVRRWFEYCPDTGMFFSADGNLLRSERVRFNRDLYRKSHLIWLYMTGKTPTCYIDHVDRDRSNFTWNNLREATPTQNAQNRIRYNTYYPGVHCVRENCFQARIVVQGKRLHLGVFATAVEAFECYVNAARRHFGEFATQELYDRIREAQRNA